MEERIRGDLVNRKTAKLPQYSTQKRDLPKRSDYVGALSWLRDVRDCIETPVVFALDDALMCKGLFCGPSDEFVVLVYGEDSVSRFNGVALLGNQISAYSTDEKNGLFFTNFNRTLEDAFANESILDMQEITGAINRYYYRNGESLRGISVTAKYHDRFKKLVDEAIAYSKA